MISGTESSSCQAQTDQTTGSVSLHGVGARVHQTSGDEKVNLLEVEVVGASAEKQ